MYKKVVYIGRLSTCKNCGKSLTSEEKYVCSNKSYCIDCYNIKLAEKADYDNLIKMICEYFEIEVPTGMILKQIKNYKSEFGYTDSGIGYTLWYIKNILNGKFIVKYGIYQVKNEYHNAEQYFLSQQKISESAVEYKEISKTVKFQSKSKSKEKSFLIDINSLLKEGE